MRKVKINYDRLTQSDFNDFLTYTTGRLTGNANFPNPPEDLADITTLQGNWQQALGKSRQGDRQATQDAAGMQKQLLLKVKRNGNYINDTANGDVAKLDSSGYTLTKVPEYQPKPDIRVVQGEHSGSGMVVIEAFPDAICYLVDLCPDPLPAPDNNTVWSRLKLSSKCSLPFSGLIPGKLYWMRFCYLTIEGEADYNQPKSFMVV